MKPIILFALVAFVAAATYPGLEQFNQNGYPVDYEQYNIQKQPYGQELAHYIGYLFHQVQQRGYTPAHFSMYLVQHGFPEEIVEYLSKHYETGLSKPYFQHYFGQALSPEFQKNLFQQIERIYKQLQLVFPQGGGYPTVNIYKYTERMLDEFRQYVAQGVVPQEHAAYVIEQLEQILKYSSVEYPNQYVLHQVYFYYGNILKYVMEQQAMFPEHVVKYLNEQIHYVFQALKHFNQQTYGHQYGQNWPQGYKYGPYNQEYQYTPYSQGYQYGPYSQWYQYKNYQPFKVQSYYPGYAQYFHQYYAPQYKYGRYQIPYKYEQAFLSAA